MLVLALLLFGAVIALTARVSRPIGYLMGLSGVSYIAQGWVIGVAGFSAANTPAMLAGILLVLTWSIWLFVSAWRTENTGRFRPA
ncbi:MAG TPA: hypothetical protein VI007_10950 [bacterium]